MIFGRRDSLSTDRAITDGISKKCSKCGVLKSISEFSLENGRKRAECKACACRRSSEWRRSNPVRHAANNRRWNKENPEKSRAIYRRRHGCIPSRPEPETCEACGRRPGKRSLNLDHNHKTGEFTGWLCGPCNCAKGLLGESSTGVEKLLNYIQLHEVY